MEFKRIYNSKFIIIILVLVSVSCALFYKAQLDFSSKTAEDKGVSYLEINQKYNQYLEELKQNEHGSWKSDLHQLYITDKNQAQGSNTIYKEVAQLLGSDVDYINGYSDNINQLIQKSESLVKQGIYSDRYSFGYNNLLKTRYDFKKLVNLNVTLSKNIWFDKVFEYDFVKYMLVAAMIITVLTFKNTEKGFMNVIYATQYGRLVLNLKRSIALVFSAILYTIMFYVPLFMMSTMIYGGSDSLNDLVQCSQYHQYSMFLISKFSYILLFIIIESLGLLTVGVICWFIISFIKNKNLGILAISILMLIEYSIYCGKSGNTVLQFFRYINIFSFISADTVLGKYTNWGFHSFILSRVELVFIGILISLVILLCITVFINCIVRPSESHTILIDKLKKISIKFCKLSSGIPRITKELNKIVISQKGYLVIAILIIVMMNKSIGSDRTYNETELGIIDYYNTVEGDSGEKSQTYIADIEKWLLDAQVKYDKYISENEQYQAEQLKKLIDTKKDILNEINNNIVYVNELKSSNINAKIVNQYIYENIFEQRMYIYDNDCGTIVVFVLILLLFEFYGIERMHKMVPLIRLAVKGRKKFWWQKFIVGVLITTFIYFIVYGINYFEVSRLFPIKSIEYSAPVQSIQLFREFPLKISIGTFMILIAFYRWLIMISVAMIVIRISMIFSKEKSFSISIIMLMPHLLYIIGLSMFSPASIILPISFFQRYHMYGNHIQVYLGGIIIITIGLLATIKSYYEWCIKGIEKGN